MTVSYFSEQIPQECEGRGCGNEPTPLMPLAACTLAVGVTMALLQVSWASPILGGTILLVVVAALRNRVEEAQASQETFQESSRPDEGRPEPPSRKPARADHRFKGDSLWGLN
jgi:hypothetical protein